MDNYDKYFDLIDGNLNNSNAMNNLSFDFRNLVLTYYENNIGKVDVLVKNKFFGLINYCLEGRNLLEAVNYKTEQDFNFSKLLGKDQYLLINNSEAKILQDIYNKYKDNEQEWNLFKASIKQYPVI